MIHFTTPTATVALFMQSEETVLDQEIVVQFAVTAVSLSSWWFTQVS